LHSELNLPTRPSCGSQRQTPGRLVTQTLRSGGESLIPQL
jgi:hypothetical protein